jgi:hypothetical protein
MKKLVLRLALVAAALAGLAGAAYATSPSGSPRAAGAIVPSITVNTPTGTLLTLKTSELAVLPQTTISVPVGGVTTTESGPTLASVLALAGVAYSGACKNDELRWWVEATSSNASAVTLTAGELDPLFGNRPAILSIAENGKFLTSSGPRLIVPNDSGARNLQHVSIITVGRAPTELVEVNPACNPPSFVPPVAVPPPGSVVINGDVANPTTLTYTQLQALPQITQTVSFLQGATPKSDVETGPTLYSVLAAANPNFLACNPSDKNRFYVEVTSSEDGNANLVSWAEIDPAMDGNQVLLSLVEDGHSTLTTDTGPRLTVPGDVRGGRYNFGSAVITVFRAPTELRIPSCAKKK